MNCYNHPIQTAVAQCSDCSKGLCSHCSTTYTTPICKSCNRTRIKNERGQILKELLLTIVFGVGIAYILGDKLFFQGHSYSLKSTILYYVIGTYFFAGIVAGWKTLTAITPRMFLVLPIIGWLLYFVIKLFLSFWVGLVMLPIRLFRNIHRLISLQKTTI